MQALEQVSRGETAAAAFEVGIEGERSLVFSSLTFLFAYLPVTLAVYFLVPYRARNGVLLAVSLLHLPGKEEA